MVTIEERAGGETVSLTGTVQAEIEVNLAFRIDGRMTERLVNVGDQVAPGQIVARLDPQNEENALRAAQADLAAARGQLVEAQNNYERQSALLAGRLDHARALRRGAPDARDRAVARGLPPRRSSTSPRTGWATPSSSPTRPASSPRVGAEPGEVVQAGRMIVQVAREDGRDAVFDVPARIKDLAPADPEIEVVLTTNRAVQAIGRVREVAPRADPVTGTFEVKVGLADPPAAMRLGSTVTGRMQVGAAPRHRDARLGADPGGRAGRGLDRRPGRPRRSRCATSRCCATIRPASWSRRASRPVMSW